MTMPITNTISRAFMTKPPSVPHSACQAYGQRKAANIKAARLRFLYRRILERKELPCKSAESALPINFSRLAGRLVWGVEIVDHLLHALHRLRDPFRQQFLCARGDRARQEDCPVL